MRVRILRWLLALTSTLAALALGLWVLAQRDARAPKTTVTRQEPINDGKVAEFPLVPLEEFFLVDEQAPIPATPELRRFYLPQSVTLALWGSQDKRVRYDPWTYVWDAGLRDSKFPWPEHPSGSLQLSTNAQGLREKGDPLAQRNDVRVLATGDSHAFGLCYTAETFASRLEQQIAPSIAPRSIEVLNAAQPGFDAFNYLGVLHRFLSFEPQVFVVLFFGGNDLISPLDLYCRFTRDPMPPPHPQEKRRRAEMDARAPNAHSQCFPGAPFLIAHPEVGERVVRINAMLFAQMQSVCKRRGVHMIVVYLPSPCDLTWQDPPAEIEIGRRISGVPEGAGSGFAAVEQRFLAAMAALSIEVLDMRASFGAQADPPYWRQDLHLNTDGHRLVAEALAPRIEALCAKH